MALRKKRKEKGEGKGEVLAVFGFLERVKLGYKDVFSCQLPSQAWSYWSLILLRAA
jgi:hypothetical protein